MWVLSFSCWILWTKYHDIKDEALCTGYVGYASKYQTNGACPLALCKRSGASVFNSFQWKSSFTLAQCILGLKADRRKRWERPRASKGWAVLDFMQISSEKRGRQPIAVRFGMWRLVWEFKKQIVLEFMLDLVRKSFCLPIRRFAVVLYMLKILFWMCSLWLYWLGL